MAVDAKKADSLHKFLSDIAAMRPPVVSWSQSTKLCERALLRTVTQGTAEAIGWKQYCKPSTLSLTPAQVKSFLIELGALLKNFKPVI